MNWTIEKYCGSIVYLFIILFSASTHAQNNIDIQGHRACRGLLPENSIEGAVHALPFINTLELDVVVSKDHQVVVSHEPYMSSEICFDLEGKKIKKAEQESFNLYEMDYAEIQEYDCGSKYIERFPNQEKIAISKPLLSSLIDTIEKLTAINAQKINYNIEIKRRHYWDEDFHPNLSKYVELVLAVVKAKNITDRCTIQSFDLEVLRYIHKNHPEVKLVFLTVSRKGIKRNIRQLGFQPYCYSPFFKLLNKRQIRFARNKGMQVIPWTVNEAEDMRLLLELGVDGIISDFPDVLQQQVEIWRSRSPNETN